MEKGQKNMQTPISPFFRSKNRERMGTAYHKSHPFPLLILPLGLVIFIHQHKKMLSY